MFPIHTRVQCRPPEHRQPISDQIKKKKTDCPSPGTAYRLPSRNGALWVFTHPTWNSDRFGLVQATIAMENSQATMPIMSRRQFYGSPPCVIPTSVMLPDLSGEGTYCRCPLWGWALHSHLFVALWPAVVLCNNLCSLQEVSLVRVESYTILWVWIGT